MSELELKSQAACFGGEVRFLAHASRATRGEMEFSVFVPPQAADGPVPVLWWLSGLTCTAENFTTKAGAQRLAAEHYGFSGRARELDSERDRNFHLVDAQGDSLLLKVARQDEPDAVGDFQTRALEHSPPPRSHALQSTV